MQTLLLVAELIIAVALIGFVLLQRSEGGGLGMGSSNSNGLITVRGSANLLTRTTAGLAAAFFVTSVLLVVLSNFGRQPQRSIIQDIPAGPVIPTTPAAPQVPVQPAAPTPSAPAAPSAPVAK